MTQLIEVFRALGEPVRLGIVARLLDQGGAQTCGRELSASLGIPAYQLSRHLKVLKASGLVREQRDGRRMHYALVEPNGQRGEALRTLIRAASTSHKTNGHRKLAMQDAAT